MGLLRFLTPSVEKDVLFQVQTLLGTVGNIDTDTNYVSIQPDGRCGRYLIAFISYILAFPNNFATKVNTAVTPFDFSPSVQETTSLEICLAFFTVLDLKLTCLQESDTSSSFPNLTNLEIISGKFWDFKFRGWCFLDVFLFQICISGKL